MAFRTNTVMSMCEYINIQRVEGRVYSDMGYECKIILSLRFVFDFIFEYQYLFLRLLFAYPPCGNFCFDFFSKNHLGSIYYNIFCTLNLISFRLSLPTRKKRFFVFSAANLLVDLTHTCKPMRFVACILGP